MENINYKDFQSICRICMSNCDKNFNKNSIMLDIFHKLTDVHFEANNELPQQICCKCVHFINEIHSFTMTYKQTHSVLMEYLNDYKDIRIKQESEIIIEETNIQFEIYEWGKNEDMEKTIEEHSDELNKWETNNALELDKSVTDSTNDLLIPISTKNDEESINDLNTDSKSSDSENRRNTIFLRNNKKYKQYRHPSVPEIKKTVKRSRYKCDQCKKSFTFLSVLKKHERVHSGERPFQCDECGKLFTQSGQLRKHKRIHSGERPYKCNHCEKSFNSSGNLARHKRGHSGEHPFKCDQCEKSFTQSGSFKDHKHIHSGERPYKCVQCEKAFLQPSKLTVHKRMHSGERPYKCDQCEKSFNQSCNLKMHKLRHSGESPYKCDQCEKAFTQPSVLTVHKRIHSGERPFKCDQCEKSFTQSCNLKKHKLIHSGERPYKCDHCEKSFNNSFNLARHKRGHSGEHPL